MKRSEETGEILFNLQNDQEWIDALKSLFKETEIGQQYKSDYYVKENSQSDADQLLDAVEILFPLEDNHASLNQLAAALRNLILSGAIQPKDKEEEELLEAPQVDLTPRDRNGKALTQAQLDWSEMTRFANESTMDAIRQRKNIDPKFRTFMATNLRREMQEQPVGDGVTPEGQVPEARGSQPSLYLIEFARKYAKEPVANLRPRGGFVTLAGEQMPWANYQDLLTKATAVGAIR
jgi:hypothetical protein